MAGVPLPPSWEAEGRAMRRALAGGFAEVPGCRVTMTLDARFPDEPGPWEVVRVGPGEEPAAFAALAALSEFTLAIAPETDGLLFDRARTIARVGGRSLGSSPDAIASAGNKLLAFERLRAAGVATPPTRAIAPGDPWPDPVRFSREDLAVLCPRMGPGPGDAVEHPAVLKPVDGAGALRTYRVDGRSGWPDPSWRPAAAVLQPWIEGEARSAALIVARGGRPHVLGFAAQRIEVGEDGLVSYRGGAAPLPFVEDELRMVSRAVRAFPGLLGWVGIDYVAVPGGPMVVVDVNPRPTTSIAAYRAMVGPEMIAGAWLDLAVGGARALPAGMLDRIRGARRFPVRFDPGGVSEGGACDGGIGEHR